MARRPSVDPASITDDPRWLAVATRDAKADGQFFYAVRSTGIYCRPSCAARTPRPENVEFHPSAGAAEAAGFRPCRRCRPDQPSLKEQHAELIGNLCRFIDAAEGVPSLAQLANRAGLSPYHLHRLFKATTGLTPHAYAAARRADRARAELASGQSVTTALYAAGYGSSGRFYAESADALGMTPGRFRAGGAAANIRFAIGQCSLGAILVAASERGICAILLGDEPEALLRELQARFPKARLLGGDVAFEGWVAAVIGFVEAPRLGLDLPLDLRGTVFQQRVWQALRQIPAGTTVTYTELAKRLGLPRSVRAVAGACAANPLAVAIPCHRVIRIDGGLAGYRWGIERKRCLLEREKPDGAPSDER